MRYDELLEQVRVRAELPTRAVAERITAVTLETVAERIPAELAHDLAARLPAQAGRYLRRRPVRTAPFDRRGFFARVHERADGPEASAAHGACVVLQLLGEAVADHAAGTVTDEDPADDLVDRLCRTLPQDLRHLVRHEGRVQS